MYFDSLVLFSFGFIILVPRFFPQKQVFLCTSQADSVAMGELALNDFLLHRVQQERAGPASDLKVSVNYMVKGTDQYDSV